MRVPRLGLGPLATGLAIVIVLAAAQGMHRRWASFRERAALLQSEIDECNREIGRLDQQIELAKTFVSLTPTIGRSSRAPLRIRASKIAETRRELADGRRRKANPHRRAEGSRPRSAPLGSHELWPTTIYSEWIDEIDAQMPAELELIRAVERKVAAEGEQEALDQEARKADAEKTQRELIGLVRQRDGFRNRREFRDRERQQYLDRWW
jgi:hypothetical protein